MLDADDALRTLRSLIIYVKKLCLRVPADAVEPPADAAESFYTDQGVESSLGSDDVRKTVVKVVVHRSERPTFDDVRKGESAMSLGKRKHYVVPPHKVFKSSRNGRCDGSRPAVVMHCNLLELMGVGRKGDYLVG